MTLRRLFSAMSLSSTGTWKRLNDEIVEMHDQSVVITSDGQEVRKKGDEITPERIHIISVSDTEMVTTSPEAGQTFQITWKRISRD